MKTKISDYWNMGTSIGFCAVVGIVLGALFNNLIFWLLAGAGMGVVLGAVSQTHRWRNKGDTGSDPLSPLSSSRRDLK